MPYNVTAQIAPFNWIINGELNVRQCPQPDIDLSTANRFTIQGGFPMSDNLGLIYDDPIAATLTLDTNTAPAGNIAVYIGNQTPIAQGALPADSILAVGMTVPRLSSSNLLQTPSRFQFKMKTPVTGLYTGFIVGAQGLTGFGSPASYYLFDINIPIANEWQTVDVVIPANGGFQGLGLMAGVVLAAGANYRTGVANQWSLTPMVNDKRLLVLPDQANFLQSDENQNEFLELTDFLVTNLLGAIQYPRQSFQQAMRDCQGLVYVAGDYLFNAGTEIVNGTNATLNGAILQLTPKATGKVAIPFSVPSYFQNPVNAVFTKNPTTGNTQIRNFTSGADLTNTAVEQVPGTTNNDSQQTFLITGDLDGGASVDDVLGVNVAIDANTYV